MGAELRPVNIGGVVVLSVFAAIWGVVGLAFTGASGVVWVLPLLISLGLFAAGRRVSRHSPAMPEAEQKRLGRLIGIWSGVEGFAIFFGNSVLIAFHRPDLIAAMVCTIVGLHFFPLARGIPLPVYNLTGLAMTLLGAGGLIVSGMVAPAVVGFGAALIMWTTLVSILWPARAALRAAG